MERWEDREHQCEDEVDAAAAAADANEAFE